MGQAVPPRTCRSSPRQRLSDPTARWQIQRIQISKNGGHFQRSGQLGYWRPSNADHYYRYSFGSASSKFYDRGLVFGRWKIVVSARESGVFGDFCVKSTIKVESIHRNTLTFAHVSKRR